MAGIYGGAGQLLDANGTPHYVACDTAGTQIVEVGNGAFGDVVTAALNPQAQIDAVYGILGREHETFTATGGTVTASSSVFVCDCGTSAGGYGVIRSVRVCRYHPGQGIRARFTAAFSGGEASYTSGAGLFTATDGLFVGYNGASFGFTRRIAGAIEIRTLTVTAAATGTGDVTVTLNDAATAVAVSSGDSTTVVARKIANEIHSAGTWFATQNGATVVFVSAAGPAAISGAFSVSGQGVTGTFAQTAAGSANDNDTGFVAMTAWDDPLDGTGRSGYTIDLTKLNVWEIVYAYLGAGNITIRVMDPNCGRFVTVHQVKYPNTALVPSQDNPSFKVGWFSASLGSTTSYTVTGACGMVGTEGNTQLTRNPFAAARTATGVDGTEVALLAIRVRYSFASKYNHRLVRPIVATVGVEGSKPATIRCYLGGTLSAPDWSYVDQSDSIVELEDTNGLTLTGGDLVAAHGVAGGGETILDLQKRGLAMQAGDVLVITGIVTAGAGSNITVGLTWQED